MGVDAIGGLPPPPATAAGAPAPAAAARPLDATAETAPDTAVSVADDLAKRAELMLVEQQILAQAREARMDRLRMTFDAQQQERAELLREMNSLRDMAMEQMKLDDEYLKKWIALI
ncbi:MAG TPA: hypothetical protein VME66_02660 [Candidatus Acidoferrales bacterium]|nr:hypothetical protein [Candidatus Acidoferrales bacterium]